MAIAVIAAGCSIFLYNWLNQWRWSVSVTASVTAPANGALPRVLLTGSSAHPVRWSIGAAYVSQLTVTGAAQGTAQVILPLPRAGCTAITAQLGGSCTSGGQLTLPSPVMFAWSGPALLASTNGEDSAASVEVTQAALSRGQPDLEVVPAPPGNPSLCFASPQGAVRLTIMSGAGRYRHQFTGREPPVSCGQAVSIRVGLGSQVPPVLVFAGVSALSLQASGRSAMLEGFAGQLSLDPGGTTVANGPEDVLVCSGSASCPLTAALSIGQAGQAGPSACPLATAPATGQTGDVLTVCSGATRSVITKDGQLVPSAWARQTDIFAPLLGALVTAFVIGPLTVFVQLLTDGLKNWPGPARRRSAQASEPRDSEPHDSEPHDSEQKEADHAA